MRIRLQRLLVATEVQPAKLFLTVLTLIFGVEAAVMVVMPIFIPNDQKELYYAILDACLLTGALAPLLWWLVIVPLRVLAATRLRLLDRIMETQEEERGRIARELHDSLGQLLTCLQVGLRAAEELTDDDALRSRLEELRNVGAETHREIRRIASGLRPPVLDDVGLQAALERHCEELNRTTAVTSSYLTEGAAETRLPGPVETACYRIAQEATTNALRHGKATQVSIVLRIEPEQVILSIRDNGCGFDPKARQVRHGTHRSIGLWSIQERAELLSGSVSLESAPGAGTTVIVKLPWQDFEQEAGSESEYRHESLTSVPVS